MSTKKTPLNELRTTVKKVLKEEDKEQFDINESSLKGIKHWIDTKEIAGISAFRHLLTNETKNTLLDKEINDTYSKKENHLRNIGLKASLLKLGYGVTKIAGSYLEGGEETQEESFIVVNLKDDPNFKKNIFKISEYFNQDSFLYKPKDSDIAVFVGTNKHYYPGYANESHIGNFYEKVNATYMSRIGSQGFAFSLNDENTPIVKHMRHDFNDRKKIINNNINEMITKLFDIETFDKLQINTKYLCDIYSGKILKEIKNF